MPNLTITDEDENVYEVGTIRNVHLDYEDHGLFAFGVEFEFENFIQGTGLYTLPEDEPSSIRLLKAMTTVLGPLLNAKGKQVYAIRGPVRRGSNKIIGIAPISGDAVFFDDIFGR